MKDRPDGPRSLLRRLLTEADKSQKAVQSPVSAPPPAASPIRPPIPDSTPIPTPVEPSTPRTRTTATIPQVLTSPEERLQAETALLQLRQKTVQVANEFADGKINRAQFLSLYAHYNEKVIIIERMLTRDPNSQAWQSVARAGHTTFLKQHFEARALSFAVYDYTNGDPITVQGGTAMPNDMITQIMQALQIVRQNRRDLKPLSRKTNTGHWIVVVPGVYTCAITLFSLEPASYQIKIARDLHYDFERANRHALERGIRQQEQLVFPHRALFEQHLE